MAKKDPQQKVTTERLNQAKEAERSLQRRLARLGGTQGGQIAQQFEQAVQTGTSAAQTLGQFGFDVTQADLSRPGGLSGIQEQIKQISDPQQRAAAQQALSEFSSASLVKAPTEFQLRSEREQEQKRAGLEAGLEDIQSRFGIRGGREVGEATGGVATFQQRIAQEQGKIGQAPRLQIEKGEDPMAFRLRQAEADRDFYLGQAREARGELGTVSAQVSDFGAILRQNQRQVQDLVNTLNNLETGLGDQVNTALEELAAEGVEGSLDANTIGRINAVAKQEGDLKENIKRVIQGITPSAAPTLPPISPEADTEEKLIARTEAAFAPSVIAPEEEVEPPPFKPNGDIVNPEFGVTKTEAGIVSPTGTVIPVNPQTNMPDFLNLPEDVASELTSMDIYAIELSLGMLNQNNIAESLKQFYTADTFRRMGEISQRHKAALDSQIRATYDVANNAVKSESLLALQDQELALQEAQLTADFSMRSLSDSHAKNEALMKGMIDAYGLEGSSAQLAIMGNLELKYNQQMSMIQRGSAIDKARIANNMAKIRMGTANQLAELAVQKNADLTTAQNQYLDKIEEIESGILASEIDRITAKQQSFQEHQTRVANIVSAAQERNAAAIQSNLEFMREIELEGIKSQGGIPTLDAEGNITAMTDSNGTPILSIQAEKLYAEMNKAQLKFDEETGQWFTWNENTQTRTFLGQNNPASGSPWGGYNVSDGQQFEVDGQVFTVGMDWFQSGAKWNKSECVGFARFFANDLPGGLWDIEDKRAIYSGVTDIGQIERGDVVFFDGGSVYSKTGKRTGHAAVIAQIHGDGTATIAEANYDNDPNRAIVGMRRIDLNTVDRNRNGTLGVFKTRQSKIGNNFTTADFRADQPNFSQIKAFENAMGALGIKRSFSKDESRGLKREIQRRLSEGDFVSAKELIKSTAIDAVGTEEQRKLRGKDRTIEFLREIQNDMRVYEAKGGKLNIFNGTTQKIFEKVGEVGEPELAALGNKIAVAVQQYRNAMSGVAFSVPESKEYKAIFPDIDKKLKLNIAKIDSLLEIFEGDMRSFYSFQIGSEAYDTLFGGTSATQPIPSYEDLGFIPST